MKKSYIIICVIIILLIFLLIMMLNSKLSSTIIKNGDTLPIIDSAINVKYISKEEGKDKDGNPYIILYYNPKDLSEGNINFFATILNEDTDFYEWSGNSFEEGIHFAGDSKEKGKMWIITIYHDLEEAYVKYTKCNNVIQNDSSKEDFGNIEKDASGETEYLDPYVEQKIEEEEPYYDSETNQYFNSYLEYESYKFYENYEGPDLNEDFDEE